MNWDRIEGHCHELNGHIKSQWAKLTDDDLADIAGKKEQLLGKIQQRYGILKEDAERQIDEWAEKINHGHSDKSP